MGDALGTHLICPIAPEENQVLLEFFWLRIVATDSTRARARAPREAWHSAESEPDRGSFHVPLKGDRLELI
jgi:hypothetical protein